MAANRGFLDPNVVLPPPGAHPAQPAAGDEHMEMEEPTQTQTQTQTQLDSSQEVTKNQHLWGALLPTRADMERVDFWRSRESYTLGRGVHNDVPLVSPKISNNHCIISWRGKMEGGDEMEVVVEDLSTNGTFINGQRIGRNNKQLLSQGQEISFGTATEDPTARQEFRYMYRHFGGGPAASGGIFDDYQLSTELGKGAFASVRRAIGIKDGNTYAVKIINQRLWHMNPGTQKMFQREMTIMSQLTHPNIVQWYQTYYDPSTIFLVMEFVNGKDLLELVIHSGTGLDDTMSRCITHNICSGVGFLHANNIVHRDLKPENVLIQNGPPMLAKIADFGLAKVVDDQTMLKTTCGTPVYLAPEVVLRPPGQEAGYTELVDSWSTGVIVYSMLTMSMPFPEEDEEMDIRDRMRMRQVMWDQFTGVTNEAVDFCRRLIEPDIALRMSMEQALAHAWLNDSRMDLAHGWTQEMSDIGASANGNIGGSGSAARGFSSYRRANGDSAYDNSSHYADMGQGANGYQHVNLVAPKDTDSITEVEVDVLATRALMDHESQETSVSRGASVPPTPTPGAEEEEEDAATPTPHAEATTSTSAAIRAGLDDMNISSLDKGKARANADADPGQGPAAPESTTAVSGGEKSMPGVRTRSKASGGQTAVTPISPQPATKKRARATEEERDASSEEGAPVKAKKKLSEAPPVQVRRTRRTAKA